LISDLQDILKQIGDVWMEMEMEIRRKRDIKIDIR
jgi:hypothetical protein